MASVAPFFLALIFVSDCFVVGEAVESSESSKALLAALEQRFWKLQQAFDDHLAEEEEAAKEAANSETTEDDEQKAATRFDWLRWEFMTVNYVFDSIVGAFLMTNLSLYVGVIFVLQWHVRHRFCNAPFIQKLGDPSLALRTLGLDMWIAAIYYDDDNPLGFITKNRAFCSSCCFVILDKVVLYFLFKHIGEMFFPQWSLKGFAYTSQMKQVRKQMSTTALSSDSVVAVDNDLKADCTNLYMDLASGSRTMLPVCLIQLGLFWLYVMNLNDDQDTKDETKVHWSYWTIAVLIQIVASEKQLGEDYCALYWELFVVRRNDVDKRNGDVKKLAKVQHDYFKTRTMEDEWIVRKYLDFLVNNIARCILLFTFPIMLAVEEPLDFVKDCTAIFFITTLDDLGGDSGSKSLTQVMAELKVQAFQTLQSIDQGDEVPRLSVAERQALPRAPDALGGFETMEQ